MVKIQKSILGEDNAPIYSVDSERSRKFTESLKTHIGDVKYKTLINIINKIAKREIKTMEQKSVKMPPSWVEKEEEEYFVSTGEFKKTKYLHVKNSHNQISIRLVT